MRLLARLSVAALAGAFIAWVVTVFVLHAMFAGGEYSDQALVELPPWAFILIGAGGALAAIALVYRGGRSPLPPWVGPAVLGGLIGVAVVVVATIVVAYSWGGPTSKGQVRYTHSGLVYGVPIGLAAGVLVGLLRARRPSAEPDTASGRRAG